MKQLNKSEISALNSSISSVFGVEDFFSKKDRIVESDFEDKKILLRDNVPLFFYREGRLVPTLKLLLNNNFLKKVVVDMGAVKFVTNGADVMRPGITKFDDNISEHDFVAVVDATHGKPLAVCEALFSSDGIRSASGGKVLKNLHYVGDKLWQL